MTIVEFYDKNPPENIISTLVLHPERVIFVGDAAELPRIQAFYQRVFHNLGCDCEVRTAAVKPHNLSDTVRVLSAIVSSESDCVFDLTGGEDVTLCAMGMVYERYRTSGRVHMHRFDLRTGTACDVTSDRVIAASQKPTLSVAQNVMLFGGVVGGTADGGALSDWEFTPSFVRALDAMWAVCREDPSAWNASISALNTIGGGGAPQSRVFRSLPFKPNDADRTDRRARTLADALVSRGVLTQKRDGERLLLLCDDRQVRRCLEKAGNLLEVRMLHILRTLTDTDAEPMFQDCCQSVYIDWDGRFGLYDTVNEIDVLAMHGMIPLFVSCKNGRVDIEELYKINAVAERFGGRHAVKMLAATYIDTDANARTYLLQRAQDMGIHVLCDMHRRSDEEIARAIRQLFK